MGAIGWPWTAVGAGKEQCVIIDVSSNWSTFGPVEKLEWNCGATGVLTFVS